MGASQKPEELCKGDKRGRCVKHDCVGKFVNISKKNWRDRGRVGGFGWVYSKIRKFICTHGSSVPAIQDINPDERFCDKLVRDKDSEYLGLKGKSD